jgi:hypothetical protein
MRAGAALFLRRFTNPAPQAQGRRFTMWTMVPPRAGKV